MKIHQSNDSDLRQSNPYPAQHLAAGWGVLSHLLVRESFLSSSWWVLAEYSASWEPCAALPGGTALFGNMHFHNTLRSTPSCGLAQTPLWGLELCRLCGAVSMR